jgi:NADH-quinone oxidoreductase subunit K
MSAPVPLEYGLWLAAGLFVIGLFGVLARRNLLFVILSVEIMINAAALAFVVAGARWQAADGQVMFLFALAVSAAEVAVGLALVLMLHRRTGSVDGDAARELRG